MGRNYVTENSNEIVVQCFRALRVPIEKVICCVIRGNGDKMVNNNGYAAYAKNKVMTASPAELTLMLYEGAIKFCNIAITAIEKSNFEQANTNIQKVENIISEFQATLNTKYPIAKDFNNVYVYIQQRLLEANLQKSTEILEEVLKHLRTLRDTWKEVMRLSAHTPEGAQVNIS